jgi:hypothetical protein
MYFFRRICASRPIFASRFQKDLRPFLAPDLEDQNTPSLPISLHAPLAHHCFHHCSGAYLHARVTRAPDDQLPNTRKFFSSGVEKII